MNYAPLVRILQRIGDLQRDLPGVLERQRAFGRFTLDQFHHERPFFNSVYMRDIRVIERSQHPRFALETGQAVRVAGEGGRKHLDGHLAPQLRVRRPPNLAHAAFAQLRGDEVMRDGLLWAHGQIWEWYHFRPDALFGVIRRSAAQWTIGGVSFPLQVSGLRTPSKGTLTRFSAPIVRLADNSTFRPRR